jgi:dolichol-phosphate mannosyltransferase
VPRVLVVTPTYDERENLAWLVHSIHAVLPDAHVLVVDDASPDGTGDVADSLAATDPRVHVLHRPRKLGLGTAYVAGFGWALGRDYELVIEMDADLSHDPAYLRAFLDAFAAGADVVVGSRRVPGGGVSGWDASRQLLSQGGSLYSRLVLGVDVRDLTTGYKGYTRRALEAIDVPTLASNGYSFQIETTYRALQKGLSVVEVPILFVDRRAGHSKMSAGIVAEAVLMPWRLRFGRARRRA